MRIRVRLPRISLIVTFLAFSLLQHFNATHTIVLAADGSVHLEKWKKAVVHLECATDSLPSEKAEEIKKELQRKFKKGEITREELERRSRIGCRDIRQFGTAIFIRYKEGYFLLTARHVVYDQHNLTYPGKDPICSMIYRVPTLDELPSLGRLPAVDGNYFGYNPINSPMFMMNLQAINFGAEETYNYTFSDPSIDLAIISLNTTFPKDIHRFAERLLGKGHMPITIQDIADGPSAEGAKIFTVGYPRATLVLGQLTLKHLSESWRATVFSLPTFSFGRVSMIHEKLPFFNCDISAYPGSSGGPVVENGKLVGIIRAQPLGITQIIKIQDLKKGKKDTEGSQLVALSRIPFSITTKAIC